MRLLMKADFTIAVQHPQIALSNPIHFGGNVIETLRAEEERVSVAQIGPYGGQFFKKGRMGLLGPEIEILASTFSIQPQKSGNGFKQSGFPRTVFSNDICDTL